MQVPIYQDVNVNRNVEKCRLYAEISETLSLCKPKVTSFILTIQVDIVIFFLFAIICYCRALSLSAWSQFFLPYYLSIGSRLLLQVYNCQNIPEDFVLTFCHECRCCLQKKTKHVSLYILQFGEHFYCSYLTIYHLGLPTRKHSGTFSAVVSQFHHVAFHA